jgi:hypothetical protein
MSRYKVRWSLEGHTYVDARSADEAAEIVENAVSCTELYLPASDADTEYEAPSIVGVFERAHDP